MATTQVTPETGVRDLAACMPPRVSHHREIVSAHAQKENTHQEKKRRLLLGAFSLCTERRVF
jgi:hypothetical protein